MARKIKPVTIQTEGRDKGKVFILTEMSATQAEKWAVKAFLALGKSGVELPDEVSSAGMAGLAAIGLKTLFGANFSDVEALMDEMMACITIQVNPTFARALIEDDIEEVQTRVHLKAEVFELHTGFSIAAALSKSERAPATKSEVSPNTKTSPGRSGR